MSTTKSDPKFIESRPNDYLYDPVYTFSSKRDFEKTAIKSVMSCMEARVRPHFLSMFSELIQFPNADLALIKGSDRIPCCMERTWDNKPIIEHKIDPVDIRGRSMTLFVARPTPISKHFQEIYPNIINPVMKPERTTRRNEGVYVPKLKLKGTQTVYRESSAQTSPWEPPYKVMQYAEDGSLPEILTLGWLSWGAGLPAGVYECKMIERARMRRAWEKSLIPVRNQDDLDKLVDALEKIERSEWAFRENEMNKINAIRMELMLKVMEDTCAKISKRSMKKLQNYWIMKQADKKKKISQLRHKSNRELRKLERKHNKLSTKYQPQHIVDEHLEYSSEIYAPLKRHGEHPGRSHFCCCSGEFVPEFKDVDKLNVIPPWLKSYGKYDPDHLSRNKDKSRKLCVRETKWTIENLGKLQQSMAAMRLKKPNVLHSPKLLKRILEEVPEPPTPSVEGIPSDTEADHQAALFLQKVIQGRAVQSIIYEGRDRNHELIEEIKTTHALLEADMNMKNLERVNVLIQQRSRAIQTRSLEKIEEVLKYLEGNTVGEMLDYLNKELLRLQNERKAHAFALLAMRERWRREAAEGGRRQKEERRRREHDEMFKQIVKIHQETVDLYLEDIIKEGLENTADEDAKKYVKDVAYRIDKAVERAVDESDYLQQEEIAADLIHNFVIPEVEKQIVRTSMRKKQEKYLLAAHESIYAEIKSTAIVKHEQDKIELAKNLEIQRQLEAKHMADILDVKEDIITSMIQSFNDALSERNRKLLEIEEYEDFVFGEGDEDEYLVNENEGDSTDDTLNTKTETEDEISHKYLSKLVEEDYLTDHNEDEISDTRTETDSEISRKYLPQSVEDEYLTNDNEGEDRDDLSRTEDIGHGFSVNEEH